MPHVPAQHPAQQKQRRSNSATRFLSRNESDAALIEPATEDVPVAEALAPPLALERAPSVLATLTGVPKAGPSARPSLGWASRGNANRQRGIRAYIERLRAEEKRRLVVAQEQLVAVAMQGREVARLDRVIAHGGAAPAVYMARAEAVARFESLVHLQEETVQRHNEEAAFLGAEIARWEEKLRLSLLTDGTEAGAAARPERDYPAKLIAERGAVGSKAAAALRAARVDASGGDI